MMMNNSNNTLPKAKRSKVVGKRNEIEREIMPWVNSPKKDKEGKVVWRFVIGNIGTLPSPDTALGLWKIDTWRDLVMNCDVNILTEINKDMRHVQEEEKIESISRGWWRGTMIRTEFLIEQEYAFREKRQQGGVALIANGEITSHIIEQGGDHRKLGRWRWIVCRGKNQRKTCIMGCYKPGGTWVTAMNQSVALQRKRKRGDELLDPLVLWIEDISDLIKEKQDSGCEIILSGDFNDDLLDQGSPVNKMAHKLGLREALIEKYNVTEGFSTYSRGSKVIDGVFLSNGLDLEVGGYTSQDDSPSDHRWIWFDIKVSEVVGTALSERARPIERKATSKVPTIKESFSYILNEQVEAHKLGRKTKTLEEAAHRQMRQNGRIDEYTETVMDQLNEILVRLIKTADSQCQKSRQGAIPSSPVMNNARGTIRIFHLLVRRWKEKGKQGRPRMSRIKRLARRYRYQGKLQYDSFDELQNDKLKALQIYKDMKPFAQDYRETYLGRIADELSQRDGRPLEHHFRRLIEQEEIKQQFRRIKCAEGRLQRKGVDMIERDDGKGGRIRINDKGDIEESIMNANKMKLLQAYNTPLRMAPLQELLGEQMDYEKWEDILRGTVKLPEEGIEEGTRLWYQFVSSQELSDFKISWTTEEYFASWAKMKEETSSAPGIHIGHIKCVNPMSQAAYVISTLALLPLQTGYAPRLWRTGIDSMIPKKQSDLRPEKLRLILLMDARFNHNNKLIGKKILEFGERHKKLADEQYGSRKGKSAIQHALNKRLVLDYIRQYRKQAVYCANDARSCYDRILFIVAYLTLRIFGVPKEAARCSVDTICKMKHYIRTIFGDSKHYYGGDKWITEERVFPHGNGQGNGNGPSLWSCISSPLLNILREEGFGISLESPISKTNIRLGAIGFVDDMDYIQTQDLGQQHDMNLVFRKAQSGLQLWDELLRTTGGSLEIDVNKTDYVAIDFASRNGIMTMKDAQGHQPLIARDTDGVYQSLAQLSVHDARKTQGVYQSPSGNETAQFEYMLTLVEKWTGKVLRSNISRHDTFRAMTSTIGRTLE